MTRPPSFYEHEYEIGNLSYEAYKHMTDAYAYAAASSISWLQDTVRRLNLCIDGGGILQIDQGGKGIIFIADKNAFIHWLDKTFPDILTKSGYCK